MSAENNTPAQTDTKPTQPVQKAAALVLSQKDDGPHTATIFLLNDIEVSILDPENSPVLALTIGGDGPKRMPEVLRFNGGGISAYLAAPEGGVVTVWTMPQEMKESVAKSLAEKNPDFKVSDMFFTVVEESPGGFALLRNSISPWVPPAPAPATVQ
ncbi:MAG TPA: hypothetical protein VFM18_05205 [Methanosarcina sp.]|nr:hypothetical protein [Methanosarcina sp.]